jgi:hypothetical protein
VTAGGFAPVATSVPRHGRGKLIKIEILQVTGSSCSILEKDDRDLLNIKTKLNSSTENAGLHICENTTTSRGGGYLSMSLWGKFPGNNMKKTKRKQGNCKRKRKKEGPF